MGLTSLWRKDPGLVVSGGAHALGLLALVVTFSHPPKLEAEIETVPVEMITTSDLNEIMNGEKTAKAMPKPQRRVDKVAELEDHKPLPPTLEAKKDTPPEPSPEKPTADPGQDDKPSQPAVAAAPPPPPTPPEPPKPAPPPPEELATVPTPPTPEPPTPEPPSPEPPAPAAPTPPMPPERPVVKTDAPSPPPRPEEVKPPDAEALAPEPPPRPKSEPKIVKVDPKPVPVPRPRPAPKKVAKAVAPTPPRKTVAKLEPTPPAPLPVAKPEPKASVFDRVAQLLDKIKPEKTDAAAAKADKPAEKPPAKQRSGAEIKEAKSHADFSLDKISALLDHEAPQRKASTGHALTQVASLGSPTGHAEKMSPSMQAQLDGWLIDHYRGCWSYFGLGATQNYVPVLRIRMAQDGSLLGPPALLNPPHDPNLRSLADSALRAVNKCNPLEIPARFRPFYDQGYKLRVVRFDPKDLS